MQKYELTVIFKSDLTEDKVDAIIDTLAKTAGATVETRQQIGKRLLAYPIKNHKEGLYFLYEITMDTQHVRQLEKGLEMEEQIIRFLLIKKGKSKIHTWQYDHSIKYFLSVISHAIRSFDIHQAVLRFAHSGSPQTDSG